MLHPTPSTTHLPGVEDRGQIAAAREALRCRLARRANPKPALRERLAPPILPPRRNDRESIDNYRDQLFRQVVAAQVLGILHDEEAVDPLRVVLDPGKGDVALTALLALVKSGAPAVTRASQLLEGYASDLAAFHRTRVAADDSRGLGERELAAIVLGMAGRPEAIDPMLRVLARTPGDGRRAAILSELSKIPSTPRSKQAFQQGTAFPRGEIPLKWSSCRTP